MDNGHENREKETAEESCERAIHLKALDYPPEEPKKETIDNKGEETEREKING